MAIENVAGTVASAPALLTVASDPSAVNGVLSFDGVSRGAMLPDSPSLRLVDGDFSIMAWVWMKDLNGGAVLAKRGARSAQGWMLIINGAGQGEETGRATFIVSSGADPRVYGKEEIGTNRWRHLAVTYRAATGLATLYLDGRIAGSGALPQPNATSSALYLGRDSAAPQYFLDGYLDEISLWNRALSPQEIFLIKSCRLAGLEPGLLAYWNCDGGTLVDLSGHGLNLTGLPVNGVVTAILDDSLHVGCGAAQVTIQPGTSAGLPQFGIIGPAGARFRVDVSSNLFDWTALSVLSANGASVVNFTDPGGSKSPRRFYRAVPP